MPMMDGETARAAGPVGDEPTPRRGLGEEIGRFRDAVQRLVRAHIDLARAEFADIADEIKSLLALGAAAFAFILFALTLIAVGLPLFLGDWLLGSMGWGILDGALFAVAAAVTMVAGALGARGRTVLLSVVAALVATVAVAALVGTDIAHRAATEVVGEVEPSLHLDVPSGWDTLLAGGVAGAVAGAILFLIVGLVVRRSPRGAIGLFFDGLVVGAVLGAILGVTSYGWQVAAGLGITIGLFVWIAGSVTAISGLDLDARFERLRPTTTIDTAKETWEWVRARIRLAPR
jgi:MFS family permease